MLSLSLFDSLFYCSYQCITKIGERQYGRGKWGKKIKKGEKGENKL